MDTETAEAVDSLRVDLRKVESSLRKDIEQLEARMRDGFAESRRHVEVITESLRDDIRILAERFASLNMKVDSLLPASAAAVS